MARSLFQDPFFGIGGRQGCFPVPAPDEPGRQAAQRAAEVGSKAWRGMASSSSGASCARPDPTVHLFAGVLLAFLAKYAWDKLK